MSVSGSGVIRAGDVSWDGVTSGTEVAGVWALVGLHKKVPHRAVVSCVGN